MDGHPIPGGNDSVGGDTRMSRDVELVDRLGVRFEPVKRRCPLSNEVDEERVGTQSGALAARTMHRRTEPDCTNKIRNPHRGRDAPVGGLAL